MARSKPPTSFSKTAAPSVRCALSGSPSWSEPALARRGCRDPKWQRNGFGLDLALDGMENVHLKGTADTVAGQVFQARVATDVIAAGLPGTFGGELPARFVLGYSHGARNFPI